MSRCRWLRPEHLDLGPLFFVLLPVLLSSPAQGAVTTLHLHTGWQEGYNKCTAVDGNLLNGASVYGLTETCFHEPCCVSDTPVYTIGDWLADASYTDENGTVYLRSHGANRVIAIEYYKTVGGRDQAYQAYVNSGTYTADEIKPGLGGGQPALAVTDTFITNRISDTATSIAIHQFCECASVTPSFISAGTGAIFHVAGQTSDSDCPDYNVLTGRLGCVETGAIGTASTAASGLARVALAGSHPKNTMRNGMSCFNSAVAFESIGMEGNTLRFSTGHEEDVAEFVILGGFSGDRKQNGRQRLFEVGRVAAIGGPGVYQPYEMNMTTRHPVKGSYDFLQVVALGSDGRVDRVSERISHDGEENEAHPWMTERAVLEPPVSKASAALPKSVKVYVGKNPDDWSFETVAEYSGDAPSFYKTDAQKALYPGDVVLISSREDLVVNTYHYIRDHMLPPGQEIVAWLTGGTDWTDARFAAEIAIRQNEDYNAQSGVTRFRTHEPSPFFILVGDAGPGNYGGEVQIIGHAKWQDPDPDRCVDPNCTGDWQIIDVRGRDLPNGPLVRLVGDDWTEHILPQLQASHEWTTLTQNSTTFPKGLWLLGDGKSQDSNPPRPISPETFDIITDWMASTSWMTNELIRESSFLTFAEKSAYFLDRWNTLDPMFVVALGIASKHDEAAGDFFTEYRPDQSQVLPGKPFVYFGVGCETACSDCDAVFTTACYEPHIGNNKPYAGWFGTASNDYFANHIQIWPYIEHELAQADGSEPMQYYIWRGLYAAAQDPILRPTVRGYLMFGGPLFGFNAQQLATSTDPVQPSPSYAFMNVYPNPGSGGQNQVFSFRLPKEGSVQIQIYDIRGRLIRNIQSETLSVGPHQFIWDTRDSGGNQVASGTYFARIALQGTDPVATRKLSIVK